VPNLKCVSTSGLFLLSCVIGVIWQTSAEKTSKNAMHFLPVSLTAVLCAMSPISSRFGDRSQYAVSDRDVTDADADSADRSGPATDSGSKQGIEVIDRRTREGRTAYGAARWPQRLIPGGPLVCT
jgi:hypothetical protein